MAVTQTYKAEELRTVVIMIINRIEENVGRGKLVDLSSRSKVYISDRSSIYRLTSLLHF
jgi:hypothetical protein